MTNFIGRLIQVGLGKESARGTAVTPTKWLPKAVADFEDTFDKVFNEQGVGVIEDAVDSIVSKKWAEGKIDGNVNDDSFALIILSALGSVSSAGSGDTGVYDHTFSVAQSAQHQSLTIEVKNPNEQLKFANAVLQKLELNVAKNTLLTFSAEFVAKKGASASNSPSYSTSEHLFVGRHVTVKVATNLAGLDGASAIDVASANLVITKNIEHDDVLGSVDPQDFHNKQFMIEGELELLYDDTTYKALALAGTEKALRIHAVNSDVTIGSTSNPELKIDLAKVKFTEWSKTSDQNEIIRQTVAFKAFYSLTDTQMVEMVMKNTIASY